MSIVATIAKQLGGHCTGYCPPGELYLFELLQKKNIFKKSKTSKEKTKKMKYYTTYLGI